jgi:2-methylaconitate cis-trans-isomerase PrpF
MSAHSIQCAIIRGGTTKGIFINSNQLPEDDELRDRLLLTLFGSPDVRQINGLGGGDPLTSKVALITASSEPDVDIDYQSGEVGIDEGIINYSTMCGNLASGVGIFALATGMITAASPEFKVRIRNLNTGKLLEALIPMGPNNALPQISCEAIDGVKGGGTEIKLTFLEPGGSITGELLPTGKAWEKISIKNAEYSCSIVDCGTLYALFPAENFGLVGNEQPELLDKNSHFKATIEILREKVAHLVSLHGLKLLTPEHVKIAIFSNPLLTGKNCSDISACVINRYKTHKAFPVTGAICLSAASVIPGTLLNFSSSVADAEHTVSIRHSQGVVITKSLCEKYQDRVDVRYTTLYRTARMLLSGTAHCFLI